MFLILQTAPRNNSHIKSQLSLHLCQSRALLQGSQLYPSVEGQEASGHVHLWLLPDNWEAHLPQKAGYSVNAAKPNSILYYNITAMPELNLLADIFQLHFSSYTLIPDFILCRGMSKEG